MNEDISKEMAIDILLEMYHSLREADIVGNEDKCIALMMAITALADISTEKLYEIAPRYWKTKGSEGTS